LLSSFHAAYLIALIAAPAAIHLGHRIGFLDRPVGYKGHAKPTPYLGGSVVLAGFLAGALAHLAVQESHLLPLFVGATVLWVVGTVDDRVSLGPRVRVVAEVLVGILLWQSGLGWSLFPGELADLVVTVLWVVGVVNAFNLMDNLDGAAGTVGAVCAGGIALLAAQSGPESLTALAVATSGACIGFLHYNLKRPAQIFLGDGGSMLLGFLVAGLSMAVWREANLDGVDILPTIILIGLPVLDMTLVIVSRIRRGAPIGKGGRDHITHRLYAKLGSTWGVALTLALAQGALCLAAIELMGWERNSVLIAAGVAFLLGVATIVVFELPVLHPEPARLARDRGAAHAAAVDGARVGADQRVSGLSPGESVEVRSMSTPRSDGATSGRSIPRTKLGP
jgi:UDP-GlcNAc:undecaprenyl-phosphate GlcNAc-1-phosphate transferase